MTIMKTHEEKNIVQAQKTQGYLEKKATSIFANWQRRYFIINNRNIQYYPDQSLDTRKGCIPIDKISKAIKVNDVEFHFKYIDRLYELKCEYKEQRDLWVSSINIIKETIQRDSPDKKSYSKSPQNKSNISLIKLEDLKLTEQLKIIGRIIKLQSVLQNYKMDHIVNRIGMLGDASNFYWFIAFKSLQIMENDNVVLLGCKFKPYELQTLYYVNEKKQIKEITQTINISKILIQPSQLILQYNDKKLKIDTEGYTIPSVKKFQKKLRRAIQMGKQYHNSKNIVITKNIDYLIKVYDEKTSSLQVLIKKQIEKVMSEVRKQSSVDEFLAIIAATNQYLTSLKNACLVKNYQRDDFYNYCCKVMHPDLYQLLVKNWNNLHKMFTFQNVGKLCDLIGQYNQLVKPITIDKKLEDGIFVFFKIYLRKKQEELIQTIKKNLNKSKSIIQNNIVRNPANIIIMQQILVTIDRCNMRPQLQKTFLQICLMVRKAFKIYCNYLIDILDEWNNPNIIVGTCNDISIFRQEISKQIKIHTCAKIDSPAIYHKLCGKQVQDYLLNTEITLIKQIFILLFSTIDKKILNRSLFDLDLGLITQAIQQRISKIANIRQDIKKHIYLTSYDEVCYFYFSCLMKSQNVDNYKTDLIVKKIQTDLIRIAKGFSNLLTEQEIQPQISDLTCLKEFIRCEKNLLPTSFKVVRRIFGNALNEAYLKNIINLRQQTGQIKKKLIQQYINLLKIPYIEVEDQKNRKSFLDTWNKSRSRRSTLSLSNYEKNQIQLQLAEMMKNKKQGYLLKKKVLKTTPTNYFKCFVRIQGSQMFEYINEEDEEPINRTSLLQLKKCYLQPNNLSVIVLQSKQSTFNFKAANNQQAGLWVQRIYEQVGNDFNKIQSENEIFRDYYAQIQTVDQVSFESGKNKEQKSYKGVKGFFF